MNVIPLHAAPRRPATAVIATLLAAVYAVNYAYLATNGLLERNEVAVGAILELLVWGVLLAGLWRGNRLAYILVTVAAIATVLAAAPALGAVEGWQWADAVQPGLRVVFGVLLLGFLLFPESSRSFYAGRRR